MSERGSIVEWAETVTEVIIVTEEYQPCDGNTTTVLLEEQTVSPIQNVLETMVQEEDDPPPSDNIYCEECHNLFKDQCDLQGGVGPSFVLDSPTATGVPQRALLTLPHGLMIGRSSIPGAGLGVMNQGPTVSPGMHFGPYEGEIITDEEAVNSDYSWEVCRRTGEYEYIDASRETHSNWMRYVNCARHEEETNLLVVQCRGSVLFHCCRSILAGEELMVWPSNQFVSQPTDAWNQIWFRKCTPADDGTTSQMFLCAQCPLSFTTECYLQRHTESCHPETVEEAAALTGPEPPVCGHHPLSLPPKLVDLLPGGATEPEGPSANGAAAPSPSGPAEASGEDKPEDNPNKCSQCGKVFMYSHHLKRHKQSVHLRTRPYCCTHCKRCFSQSSGLRRHQLTHQKRPLRRVKVTLAVTASPNHPSSPGADPTESEHPSQTENPPDPLNPSTNGASEPPPALTEDASGVSEEEPHKCSPCGRVFTNEYHLKRHQQNVHSDTPKPYCCSQCKRCFSQSSDLDKHLQVHQRQKKKTQVADVASEDEEENRVPVDESEDPDPTFVAPLSVAQAAGVTTRPRSQRMKHLGSRSRLSAITRLIAPKRRQSTVKRKSPGPVQREQGSRGPEAPDSESPDGMDADGETTAYDCAECKGAFADPEELEGHECSRSKEGPYICPKCGAVFKKYGNLLRHDRVTHSGKTYPCDDCGHLFTRPAALKRHQEMDSCKKVQFTSEIFPCSYCQFSFTSKLYLDKHMKRHHPVEFVSLLGSSEVSPRADEAEEAHNCAKCGKSYNSFKSFKAHKCMKQSEILYLCTECGKGFSCLYALKQHHLFHTGEKPHRCPHCEKCFMLIGQLNVHIRTHTGEKPYLCTHCGESFRQSGDLKRHEGKHTGVRPHQCSECGKSFSRPQSLKAHQLLHSGQRLFKCTQCGKSFSRGYHLKRHHQKMHTY
ncbi:histone-lysine N-methyltransferase PRDM9 [Osmerus mordax]|uniref:histone-lysine N-methyltransferase PRDM9 n=1 Tax=Osmerus mordax TaxID=8014 RepID=UPI00350F2105